MRDRALKKLSVRRAQKPKKHGTTELAKDIERLSRRFRDLERRVEQMDALEAMSLRILNQQQAVANLVRLHADLKAMRDRGIIDDDGRRLKPIPDMSQGSCDA
jgi:molybdenum-dependent DNA-binding transcriptional regulator ModE